MSLSEPLFDVEQCRSYLCVLARLAMKSFPKAKADESDVVQETLLQAHRNRSHFRGKTQAELLSWLREILKNKLCDASRAFHRAKRDIRRERSICAVIDESSAALENRLIEACLSPSERAIRNESIQRLTTALHSLPGRQREAIELHYLMDYSFSAVAAHMGLNRDQVAGLIRAGVGKLQASHCPTTSLAEIGDQL